MRRTLAGLLTLVGVAFALTSCQDDPEPEPSPFVVQTEQGAVRGVTQGGILSWRGIPYAAAPVGDLRWRDPEPPDSWSDVRDATRYGPGCLQGPATALGSSLIRGIEDTDEDCLTLNVHRPIGTASELPVMVWIHGGAFNHGAGSQQIYNSPALVRRGVVLVTLNYRLGRLGFFAHPALTAESGERIANFGLLDQMRALEWVRANIAAFGGDPANVTIFGESAGGASVNALLSSPRAAGLFDRAISESGLGREASKPFGEAQADGRRLMAPFAGSDPDAADLREVPAADVMSLDTDLLKGDAPVVDDVVPMSVADTFEAGAEADVPYLVGTTDLELPDVFFTNAGADPDEIRDGIVGANRAEAVATYGGEEEFALHLMTDVIFSEPARHLAELHARRSPTYRYRFAIAAPELKEAIGGAPHASEIPYVFDTTIGQRFPLDNGPALAATISDYWVAFARTGTPDNDGSPAWPTADAGRLLEFTNDGPRAIDDPWRDRLDAVQEGYDERS